MSEVGISAKAKLNYRNRDGGTVQSTTDIKIELDKWHYMTYANNGTTIEMNLDFDMVGYRDLLNAEPFYYVRENLIISFQFSFKNHNSSLETFKQQPSCSLDNL